MSLPVVAVSVELLDAPYYEGVKRCQLFHSYLDCLREAGLIPLLIAPDAPRSELEQLLSRVDGILLTGGDDIDLSLNGGPALLSECKPVPQAQQLSVLAMVDIAKEHDIPLLGICLGMQVLGLSHDAELNQHLDQHQAHTKGIAHDVTVSATGKLMDAVGDQPFEVLSYHHQGLNALSSPLKVVAAANDGTIEAIEHPDFSYFVGVQWHPEKTPRSTATLALFASFAEAVNHYHASRVTQ